MTRITRRYYPFSAIVGQEELKQALLLNIVYPGIGGVLIRGEKGTAKSTAVRALQAVLPPLEVVQGCPCGCDPHSDMPCPWCASQPQPPASMFRPVKVVELPVGSTEDRVVGSLDLEAALREGKRRFEPGILAEANRGILYVDEINLLDDHIVDVLLDAAAMGVNTVEREGVSWSHPARFVLVGTMNPEEGELRPQLLDRFGLCVEVKGMTDPDARLQVMTRRAAFEDDPEGFCKAWQAQEEQIAKQIICAQKRLKDVDVPEAILRSIVELAIETEVDGHRADIVMLKTVKALAALRGDGVGTHDDVLLAARLALPHRMRRKPFQKVGSAKVVQ